MKLWYTFISVIALTVFGCASGASYEVTAQGNEPGDPTFRSGNTADPPDPTFRPDYDAGQAPPIPDSGHATNEDAGHPATEDACPTDPALYAKRTCEQSYECCTMACTNAAGVTTAACVSVCDNALKSCIKERDQAQPDSGDCKHDDDDKSKDKDKKSKHDGDDKGTHDGDEEDDDHHGDDKEHKTLKH